MQKDIFAKQPYGFELSFPFTIGHEIMHSIEDTKYYEATKKALFAYATKKGELETRRADLTGVYDGVYNSDIDTDVDFELAADLGGDYIFTDADFATELYNADKNAFQKIFDEIKYWIKLATAGSEEARLLEKAKHNFEKALRSTFDGKASTSAEDGTQYSISEIVGDSGKNYGVGVKLDSTLLDNLTETERKEMVRLRVVDELAGNAFVAYDSNNNPIEINIADSKEKIKTKSGEKKPAVRELWHKNANNPQKQEAVVLSNELIEASSYDKSKPSTETHDWLDNNGKNDWEYWTVYIQDKNNAVWKATLNVANSQDGRKILYDIDPIKKVEGSVKSVPTATKYSISRSEENVNSDFSISSDSLLHIFSYPFLRS